VTRRISEAREPRGFTLLLRQPQSHRAVAGRALRLRERLALLGVLRRIADEAARLPTLRAGEELTVRALAFDEKAGAILRRAFRTIQRTVGARQLSTRVLTVAASRPLHLCARDLRDHFTDHLFDFRHEGRVRVFAAHHAREFPLPQAGQLRRLQKRRGQQFDDRHAFRRRAQRLLFARDVLALQ
jgi:hypothetical protein